MAEEHGNIDRIEYYYVIKAWEDKDGNKHYLFDHDTCSIRFPDGALFNNKIGQWVNLGDKSDKDTEFCDDIWEKLNMDTALKEINYWTSTTEDNQ
jgi:hypothetical protein